MARLPAPATELTHQAFLASRHRPSMIRGEDRLHQKRQPSKQGLLGADSPVEGDVDGWSALLERPRPFALEVTVGDDREPVRVARLDDFKLPPKPVRQPAFRQQPDAAPAPE